MHLKYNGYLAWLDVLGFKDIAKRNPKFAGNIGLLLQQFEYSLVHGQRVAGKTPDGKDCLYPDVSKRTVRAFIMSDTFIICSMGDTSEDLKNVLYAVWWLMPNGFAALDEDLALRGAISKGTIELIFGQSHLIDSCIIVQGDAAIEAVELESKLSAGVCKLTSSVINDLHGIDLDIKIANREGIFNPVIEWEIPEKDSNGTIKSVKSHVINWPLSPVDISKLTIKFNRMIKNADSGRRENRREKLIAENTKEFYESIKNNRRPNYKTY